MDNQILTDFAILFFFFGSLMAVVPVLVILYDLVRKTQVSCDWFGWHVKKSSTSTACTRCNKQVVRNSKGNWE